MVAFGPRGSDSRPRAPGIRPLYGKPPPPRDFARSGVARLSTVANCEGPSLASEKVPIVQMGGLLARRQGHLKPW